MVDRVSVIEETRARIDANMREIAEQSGANRRAADREARQAEAQRAAERDERRLANEFQAMFGGPRQPAPRKQRRWRNDFPVEVFGNVVMASDVLQLALNTPEGRDLVREMVDYQRAMNPVVFVTNRG